MSAPWGCPASGWRRCFGGEPARLPARPASRRGSRSWRWSASRRRGRPIPSCPGNRIAANRRFGDRLRRRPAFQPRTRPGSRATADTAYLWIWFPYRAPQAKKSANSSTPRVPRASIFDLTRRLKPSTAFTQGERAHGVVGAEFPAPDGGPHPEAGARVVAGDFPAPEGGPHLEPGATPTLRL